MTQSSFFSVSQIRNFRVMDLSGPVSHMIFVKFGKVGRVILAFRSGKVGYFSFPDNPAATSAKATELPCGHNSAITAVLSCGYKGRPKEEGWPIFTGGLDGTVRFWVLWGDNVFGSDPRTENGAQIQVMRGHRGSVTSLAILGELDKPGVRVYSGGMDGTIIEWQRSKNAAGLRFPSFHSSRIFRFFEPSESWPASLLSIHGSELLVGDSTGCVHVLDVVNNEVAHSPVSNASAVTVSGSGRLRKLRNDHVLGVEALQIVEYDAGRFLVTSSNDGVSNIFALPELDVPTSKVLTIKSSGHERRSGPLVGEVVHPKGGEQLLMLLDKVDAQIVAAVGLQASMNGGYQSAEILQQKIGSVGEGPGPWNFCAVPAGLLTGFPDSESSLGLIISANASGMSFHSLRSEISLPSLVEANENSAVVWMGLVESAASGCLSSSLVVAHESGTLKFWDLEGSVQKPLAVMTPGIKQVTSLRSALLLPDLSCVLTGHDNGALLQWPLTRSFQAQPRLLTPHSHTNSVTCLVRYGSIVASCGISGRVNFWRCSLSEGFASFAILKRENLQPVMVDASGVLCAVLCEGSFIFGSNSGKLYSIHALGDNYEQVKVTECSYWPPIDTAVVALMKSTDSTLLVVGANNLLYRVAPGKMTVVPMGRLENRINFSFSPSTIEGRKIFFASTDGLAKTTDIDSMEEKEIGRVGFSLSPVVAYKGRVYLGGENGRIVVVDV